MDIVYPSEGVVLLWGFVDAQVVQQVAAVASKTGTHVFVPSLERCPNWVAHFSGTPVLIDTILGEYAGALGTEQSSTGISRDKKLAALIEKYKRQHPNWSEERIKRAVAHKMSGQAANPKLLPKVRQKREQDCERMIGFLEELTKFASITLLLDDGGTISVDIGGTAAKPAPRFPKFDESIELSTSQLTAGFLREFPNWVPVTLVN